MIKCTSDQLSRFQSLSNKSQEGGGIKAKITKSFISQQIFHLKTSNSETKGRRGRG